MQIRRLLFSILVLSIGINVPRALWAQSGITEGFEAGFPSAGWTFSGPGALGGVSPAITNLAPTEGAQFAWISTGCASPIPVAQGTTCPDVATAAATYGSLYDGPGTSGLPTGQGLGAPTVKATLTSPAFSLGSTDTISFDVNFVTTDGTYDFADFAVAQLIPTSGPPINLFVANTTCPSCAAVPPVGLMSGIATQNPATASFSGATVTFGSTTYGNVAKFGGGLGGPTGWIHVSSSAPVGNYQLSFVVTHVGDLNYPSALAIDNVQTTTTVPQPIAAGTTTTSSFGVVNQKFQIPANADMGGAAFVQVTFVEVPPGVFNTTRLPATSPNTFSGGTAVPPGTTCTEILGAGGNCIVIQSKCFDINHNPFTTCPVKATTATDLIGLTYQYGQGSTQSHPALLIADDNQNNWANITTSFNGDCCTIKGGTSGTNMDTVIADLGQYASGGLCLGDFGHQILQPINADGSSVFKQGSTVPAKFRVCDANGFSVGTPGVVTSFKLVQIVSGGPLSVDESVYSTTPDTAFRYDTSGHQWIFNISTKLLTKDNTYYYVITLNDGSTIPFHFTLR